MNKSRRSTAEDYCKRSLSPLATLDKKQKQQYHQQNNNSRPKVIWLTITHFLFVVH